MSFVINKYHQLQHSRPNGMSSMHMYAVTSLLLAKQTTGGNLVYIQSIVQ